MDLWHVNWKWKKKNKNPVFAFSLDNGLHEMVSLA
jgi:hypothetical protein